MKFSSCFALGSIWKTSKMRKNVCGLWQLILPKKKITIWKMIWTYERKIRSRANLDNLGKRLLRMDENERAGICYRRLLEETEGTFAESYLGLGCSSIPLEQLNESFVYFKNSLAIHREICGVIENFQWAVTNLTKALAVYEHWSNNNALTIAATHERFERLYSIYSKKRGNEIFSPCIEYSSAKLTRNTVSNGSCLFRIIQNVLNNRRPRNYFKIL